MRLARVLWWAAVVLLVGAIIARNVGEPGNTAYSVLFFLSMGMGITAGILRRRALRPETPVPWRWK